MVGLGQLNQTNYLPKCLAGLQCNKAGMSHQLLPAKTLTATYLCWMKSVLTLHKHYTVFQ